jgi:hypothetical protein
LPKRELGWRSSSSLSPPSVLDRLDDLDGDGDGDDDDHCGTSHIAAAPPRPKGAAAAVAAAIAAVSVNENDCAHREERNTAGIRAGTEVGVGRGAGVATEDAGEGRGFEESEARGAVINNQGGPVHCHRGHQLAGAPYTAGTHSAAGGTTGTDQLSVLQQEMAWAQAALDDRRQHLRRMRLQRHQMQLQRGGVGIR